MFYQSFCLLQLSIGTLSSRFMIFLLWAYLEEYEAALSLIFVFVLRETLLLKLVYYILQHTLYHISLDQNENYLIDFVESVNWFELSEVSYIACYTSSRYVCVITYHLFIFPRKNKSFKPKPRPSLVIQFL